MPDIKQKLALARAFGDRIQETLTRREFDEAIYLNKCEPDPDGLVCHTHDFVDANEVMFTAFVQVTGRAPDMNYDSDLEWWNDAWAIAKAADFFA